MKTVTCEAEMAFSPFDKGLSRVVHHRMLLMAKEDTGLLWPRQETLAAKIGCCVRVVRNAIRELVAKGYLQIVERIRMDRPYRKGTPTGRGNVYRVVLQEERKCLSGEALDASGERTSSASRIYKNGKEEGKGEELVVNAPGSAGRDDSGPTEVEDADVSAKGALPEDDVRLDEDLSRGELKERDRARRRAERREAREAERVGVHLRRRDRKEAGVGLEPGTRAWANHIWTREAGLAGIRHWNRSHLNGVITALLMDHTWDQVCEIIENFFRDERDLKRKAQKTDLVRIFHQSLNNGLVRREAEGSRKRPTGIDIEAHARTANGGAIMTYLDQWEQQGESA